MKNTLKNLGIIAFAAIIGFSMSACDLLFPPEEEVVYGKLTLTGFQSSYNGKHVLAKDSDIYRWAADCQPNSNNSTYTPGVIANGQVILNTYLWDGSQNNVLSGSRSITLFIRNDDSKVTGAKISDPGDEAVTPLQSYTFTATFTNGNAAHAVHSSNGWAGSINYLP